jgi:methylmalonyl-CoA mutase N-terminal domain/subunit
MDTQINNEMLKIQAAKNIVIFPIAFSLKNVVTSLSNEKEE